MVCIAAAVWLAQAPLWRGYNTQHRISGDINRLILAVVASWAPSHSLLLWEASFRLPPAGDPPTPLCHHPCCEALASCCSGARTVSWVSASPAPVYFLWLFFVFITAFEGILFCARSLPWQQLRILGDKGRETGRRGEKRGRHWGRKDSSVLMGEV